MFDRKEYMKKYYRENKEYIKERIKKYYQEHKEHKKEYMKNYYQENKKIISKKWKGYYKGYYKEYYQKNKYRLLNYQKEYHQKNKEKHNENAKQYRKNNRLEVAYRNNKYKRNKMKTDFRFNLNSRISIEMYKSLKGNKAGRHWESLVGYTLNDLIKRLKKTMPKNYTWQDYLEGKLHIDHIIPISAFNFDYPEHIDFKRCWALENLQLLPAKENLIKRNKLARPFQPALKI